MELETRTLLKNVFFWSNPYKIEVETEVQRNARVFKLWSHDNIYSTM